MGDSADDVQQDSIKNFISMPAHHYDDDVENTTEEVGSPPLKMGLKRRFHRFMFEKEPSGYSSISPRKPDGTRTKIFFFNGNGRGR